jgi:hypothetical protein
VGVDFVRVMLGSLATAESGGSMLLPAAESLEGNSGTSSCSSQSAESSASPLDAPPKLPRPLDSLVSTSNSLTSSIDMSLRNRAAFFTGVPFGVPRVPTLALWTGTSAGRSLLFFAGDLAMWGLKADVSRSRRWAAGDDRKPDGDWAGGWRDVLPGAVDMRRGAADSRRMDEGSGRDAAERDVSPGAIDIRLR